MIEYQETNGVLSFKVKVVPRASRTEIAGEHDGALRVRLTASPVEGAANEELIRALARSFGVPQKSVDIKQGRKSRLKSVCITGGSVAVLKALGQS